jgi:Holliday junction resolvase
MPEYDEQRKEIKKQGSKINGKINENSSKNLENEFQPESRFEENDEIGNDFIPIDESPNNSELIHNSFEPLDDEELKLEAGSNMHPDERERILEEKKTEDVDKKYLKEKYDNNGKPIEIPKYTSKETFYPLNEIKSSDSAYIYEKHSDKKFKIYHWQKIGSISELSLIRDLEINGQKVSIPYGDFQRYDILIEEKGKIKRVQVKTSSKNERFPIQSSSRKRGTNSYKGEIDYFGVFVRNENKSYLIPMSEIEENNISISMKLDDSIKERFGLKNKNLGESNGEKASTSVINEMIYLTQKNKVVLNQLGSKDDNVFIYDSIVMKDNENLSHNIKEIEMIRGRKTNGANIMAPSKKDVARVAISADLMINGFVISEPFSNNSNYDFIIQQKYNRKPFLSQNNFYKIKVFEDFSQSNNLDKKIINFDYAGIYSAKSDESYLIPAQSFCKGNSNYEPYEINRKDNLLKEMTFMDRGDATEWRIAAEFMKHGYNVFQPIVGRPSYDLIVKKKSEYYTIEVKTARTFKEKDSTYVRFDINTRKLNTNRSRVRGSYKGKVDFIASASQDSLKSYIVPINTLPNNDAKLKIDRRKDMRQMHHGTLWAEDYEFGKLDEIVKAFKSMKTQELKNAKLKQDIEKMSPEKRKMVENAQILDILRGNREIKEILSSNPIIAKYAKQYKNLNPKNNMEYQSVLSVNFRDFLITQPDLKPIINNYLKENNLYGKGEVKHQIVYEYFDTFYYENNRGPSSLELYQTFLNFKSYELRSKLRIVRKMYPHYYPKKRDF